MVTNRIIFFATSVQPNPEEIDYWVDLSDNPYGGSIKYFNGTEWVRLAASGGVPDLSNYYTKTQINNLLNNKADVGDVDSKVDDEEVKDVIKDIQFNTSNPNGIAMVMFKYDGSNKTVSIPVASTSSAGIITSKDFLDFVKQHQLQELHTEMIDTFADIRAKYQKKLIAGLNIEIDQETNVISASGDLAVQWDNITGKPDFKPVATSGDYNDLINKLKPGKDVSISEDNTISIAIDSDSLEQSLATLQSNIDKEAATARAAETKLGNDIATEKNRAKAKEEELDNKITDHTAATNAALALKADKSDTYTKAQVDAKLSGAYKVKGSSTFEALPKDNNVVGDVYNITNAFNLGGKHYDAGTNVVWTEDGWDALSGSFDTTAIEGSIQEVADDLAQEILDRTQADTTINNNVSSLTNRVKVNEDKLTIINGNESTTGSIANAIKQAKSYTDTTVTAEQTRAEAAEQKLTSDLASEVERAKGAESANATAIANEVTRAKGAESANATAIANEVERATGVEEALRTDVEDLTGQALILENTKVNKVEGKGLSTNDYTTPEKNKLAAIEAEANKYVLPAATTTTLGGIIVGDGLSIDDTGKLVATYTYTLPKASSTVLGGVKIGSNITNTDGTISLTKANVTSALGVDPTTTYVEKAGDTMTGLLRIKNSVGGAQLELYSTESDGGAYVRFYNNNQTVNTWYLGVGASNNLNIGYNTVTKATFGDGQLALNTGSNLAPIKTNSTTLCTNLNADMVDGYHADNLDHIVHRITIKGYIKIEVTKKYFANSLRLCQYTDGYVYTYILTINAYDPLYTTIQLVNSRLHTGQQQFYVNTKWYIEKTDSGINIYIPNNTNSNTTVSSIKYDIVTGQPYTFSNVTTLPDNVYSRNISFNITSDNLEDFDWYGVAWSETSSNPDCTRIGNMDMHRSLPIQSMMKPFAFQSQSRYKDQYVPLQEDFINSYYNHNTNTSSGQVSNVNNIMIRIPEFWYTDEYVPSSKTHNLKICPHAKPGWNHHKEAFVGAYEAFNLDNNRLLSTATYVPSVNFTRQVGRTCARANGFDGETKWNLYTYEEHRAICHLFLVEYATRNSQKAVNTVLTPEGFRQGGLGSGCTTGTVTIDGAQTWSFIPTGSSDSLGSGSGEVTVTIQQTDSSGSNTSTITRKCNRYRGIENPFGHIWKHTDDIIGIYEGGWRTYYKSIKPDQFATNKNNSYKPLTSAAVVTGYKTEIRVTPTCDFFAEACTNGPETTYWCDYNWDNTDTSEHCLLIGGPSTDGNWAGLFALNSANGVGISYTNIGSRLTYLPWAE